MLTKRGYSAEVDSPNMRAVVQRVSMAKVTVGGRQVASIQKGLLVLLGVANNDTESDARWMASKIANLRVFEDKFGKINLSVQDVGGSLLLVSNFTVCGDAAKGNRPSFASAAPLEAGRVLYELVIEHIRSTGVDTQTGVFGETMSVELTNDGPVTIVLNTPKRDVP